MTIRHMDRDRERPVDIEIGDTDATALLLPRTPQAQQWLENHLPTSTRRFAGGWVIEQRYADELVQRIEADGLEVL